ncbi:DUF1003 domain-containing protein [Deinococcus oregonensis]|uniref:DUF1003 domain-containing protein n=1 Tax=Deinococcus oregonensis TaxID=1805970 RepID=A0ABV6AWC0_9DEIO
MRPGVASHLQATFPQVGPDDRICLSCINRAISDEIDLAIAQDQPDFVSLQAGALRSLEQQELVTKNLNAEYDRTLPFGDRMADWVADFGGSWAFIGLFIGLLIVWVAVNGLQVFGRHFDPYPFILLNLVLSSVAALQAPVILMSQNRQEKRDHLRAEHDYEINLKGESEVRTLQDKLDHLSQQQ